MIYLLRATDSSLGGPGFEFADRGLHIPGKALTVPSVFWPKLVDLRLPHSESRGLTGQSTKLL